MEEAAETMTYMEVEFKAGALLWLGNEKTPWRVLDVERETETALLIAEKPVCERPYHSKWTEITWEQCDLRKWLNEEYYEKTFSEEEKAAILECELKNPDNPNYGTKGGNDTRDKVFLLSIEEAEKYFMNDRDRSTGTWWWLRSPGRSGSDAAVVNGGGVYYGGNGVIYRSGVRPALKINLKSELFQSFISAQSSKSIIIKVPQIYIRDSKVLKALKNVKDCTIPEGVTSIGESAFSGCRRLISVIVQSGKEKPSKIKEIGKNIFSCCVELKKVSIPVKVAKLAGKRIFDNCTELSGIFIAFEEDSGKRKPIAYSEKTNSCSLDDCDKPGFWNWYDLEILNNGPKFKYKLPMRLLGMIGRLMDPVELSEENRALMTEFLTKNAKKLLALAEELDEPDLVSAMFEHGIINSGNQKALLKLINASENPAIAALASAEVKTEEPKATEEKRSSAEDSRWTKALQEAGGEKEFRNMKLIGMKIPTVKLRSSEEAPEALLKYILVSYGKQLRAGIQIDREADAAAEELSRDSLCEAIDALSNHLDGPSYPSMLPVICRYGNAQQIKELLKAEKQWSNWRQYGIKGRKAQEHLSRALALSDTHEAVIWLNKRDRLGEFARIRGISEAEVFEEYLFDFGFDEHGRKVYDLGTTTVTVSLNSELKLALYDNVKGKNVRGLPQKGVDRDLRKKAADDLSDLRSNLKKAVSLKTDQLFSDYLQARSVTAEQWSRSYLKNPVLRAIASLLVWQQGTNSFVLTEAGTVTADGKPYTLGPDPILPAHPLDLTAGDTERWQHYFNEKGLKQPFEQIWEPAYRADEISADRYSGIPVRFKYLKNRTKHGIDAAIYYTYEDVTDYIHLKDCELDYTIDEYDFESYYDDNRSLLETKAILGEFRFREFNRQVNHIVYLLDKLTVYERVGKDDLSVRIFLPKFSLPQIMDFIQIASENKAMNVLPMLMEYKSEHFADFDPMDEFTLDLI